MKNTLALVLMVFGIVGCSNQEETLIVICESERTFHDSSLTFDFENNIVSVKQTLNEYGYESKKTMEKLAKIQSFKKGLSEGGAQDMLNAFNEDELTRHIRSIDGGFIVFGMTKERDELVDFEWTLNRADLKMKKVRRMAESMIPENSGLDPMLVSYEECKKPVI